MNIRVGNFTALKTYIYQVRGPVFEIEQGVPRTIERDGLDPDCTHVLALDKGHVPIGTARLMPSGKIGRMAVVKEWRGKGVGGDMLAALIKAAKQNRMKVLKLHSQKAAIGFYSKFGFKAKGPEFIEADIVHVKMELPLSGKPSSQTS